MNKVAEFLTDGSVTLKTVKSKVNGDLTVKWDTYGGYQILGGGLWQVGGPVSDVWKAAFKKLPDDFSPASSLILGLGGGTIAKLERRKFPKIKITGVDIDETIVQLGKKYIGLNKLSVDIHISDATAFLKENSVSYDLICVDMYVGSDYPLKFESEEFIASLKKILNKGGILIVNRLYYGQKRKLAEEFLKKLKKNFSNVSEVYPDLLENVIYIAA